MQYFRTELPVSPIGPLLDKVEGKEGSLAEDEAPPTIEQFLDEEDILRECRGDNQRLIAYLCRPEVVRALVSHCVNIPSRPEGVKEETENENATDEEKRSLAAAADKEDKRRFKYPYVASELLSADIRALCDVVVGDDEVMDSIFACLEDNNTGELNSLVATHFAKICVSLLKTRNSETITQMKRRKQTVIEGLLKHISLGPIAELLIRILDGPDLDRGHAPTVAPPSDAALELLADADVLNGLAECFVCASTTDVAAHEVNASQSSSESEAHSRRWRAETLSNATTTIYGLAERMLQLPTLGVPIPSRLSPYHTPKVVARMLDAGLHASYAPVGSDVDRRDDPSPLDSTSTTASESHTALLHALGLAANLMTTESNVWKEDDADGMDPDFSAFAGAYRPSERVQASNTESSLNSTDNAESSGDAAMSDDACIPSEEPGSENDESRNDKVQDGPPLMLRGKGPGDTIISTAGLEAELVVRFQRLSHMFGSNEQDEEGSRPLGSLRLKLAEFFVACMKKASRETVEHIVELGVPRKLLELFLRYEWSSMLHGVVTSSVVASLEGGPIGAPARSAWFSASLVPWLMNAWSKNDLREEEKKCRFRAGYMGHLIKIGSALRNFLKVSEKDEVLKLMSEDTLQQFKAFAEERHEPAFLVEDTPLCADHLGGGAGSDGEEIYEETTEVFDMGVGEVIEGLTQGDPKVAINRLAKYLFHKSDESNDDDDDYDVEEVTPIEVGDLSHFGTDDDDIEQVRTPSVENTNQEEMRDKPQQSSRSSSEGAASSADANGSIVNIADDPVKDVDSDDDDGSYEAFVGKQSSNDKDLAKAFESRLHIGAASSVRDAQPPPSPSLEVDAAVTEIDEPRPLTPAAATSSAAGASHSTVNNNMFTAEFDDSSDDDDPSDWVAFSEVDLGSSEQTGASSNVQQAAFNSSR